MTTWFTADTHFDHKKIIEYQPNRMDEFGLPDTDAIDEMNEAMVDQWNSQVAPGDVVWHLGDFAMGKIDESLQYASRLNGHIHLIMGNHDRPHPCVCKPAKRDEWYDRYYEAGFMALTVTAWLDFDGRPVMLNHFPYEGDHMPEDRYDEWRPENTGRVLLHGHVHGLWRTKGQMINVGLDAHGGRLIHQDEVMDLVREASATPL